MIPQPSRPGHPPPLGAHWDGAGTAFALYSGAAQAIELCRYDDDDRETRTELAAGTDGVWRAYLPDVGPGQRYGYRVHGPFDPARGLRCDPSRLLLDPYARAIEGELSPAACDAEDSAPHVPHSVVGHDEFDWGDDMPPATPWDQTVLYELHLRGFTKRHPAVPAHERGSYAGLAHPEVIAHLRRLGVTAVELLPVHHFVTEPPLQRRGLTNYWGYNPVGLFAPHAGYRSRSGRGSQVGEFKAMVRALHASGLEVILDVVYNHTAEGDEAGPMLSLRGIDNAGYYRLVATDPSRYDDRTGCGNMLDLRKAAALALVTDSLRYWVEQMHVDGFRFDLTTVLSRDSTFAALIGQDPVLRQVKLIAEPWDCGPDGYQLGHYPAPWAEWNDRYRNTVRDVWRPGGGRLLPELANRLTGSADVFGPSGRPPWASINYVTCHDGFTARDLTTYDGKRNHPNGEGNRDGSDDNRSWGGGVDGEADDPDLVARRQQRVRTMLATLLLSAGTPMLLAGDELGRTQHGNNNAYCQDNDCSWLDWDADTADWPLCGWVGRLVALRHEHPVLRPATYAGGRAVAWFAGDGTAVTREQWSVGSPTLGMYMSDQAGHDSLFVVVHVGEDDATVTLPGPPWAATYQLLTATTNGCRPDPPPDYPAGAALAVPARSLLLFGVRRPANRAASVTPGG